METKVEKTPEYKVIFQNKARICEEVPKNSLQELCTYIFMRTQQLGDPEKIVFPTGEEYYWGETGHYFAHQFAAKGRITEAEFIQHLADHTNDKLVIAKFDTENLKQNYINWSKEYKLAEQNLQEKLAGMSSSFEEYMLARKVEENLKNYQFAFSFSFIYSKNESFFGARSLKEAIIKEKNNTDDGELLYVMLERHVFIKYDKEMFESFCKGTIDEKTFIEKTFIAIPVTPISEIDPDLEEMIIAVCENEGYNANDITFKKHNDRNYGMYHKGLFTLWHYDVESGELD